MQNLEKLFESLDEKVFTTELKESLETQFNEAVDAKAEAIAESKIEMLNEKSEEHIEMLNEKSEEHIEMLNEKSEEHIEMLNEKSEEHIEMLNEKAEEFVEIKQTEMLESLDKYMDRVVEEFVSEAQDSLDESLKSEKADMIIEAFDSILVAAGVEVATIMEAKDEAAPEAKLAEAVAKYDALVDDNIKLTEQNAVLIKMGVISELTEGLSIVEASKFKKLAALVEFEKTSDFTEKLETIKESIKGPGLPETKEEKLDEASKDNEEMSWAHLV